VELDPYISTADLEALLGVSLADPSSLMVKITLDSACQTVRTYLGQYINLIEDDVEVHSGTGRRKLRLRQRPVRAVTEVKIDDLVTTNYTVRGAIITLKGSDVWTYGNDNVEVTYDHGWDIVDTPDPQEGVPADIRLVTLLIARRVFDNVGESSGVTGALTGETIGDYSYTLSDASATAITSAAELVEAERYVLDRYRIDLIGDSPTF